MRQRGVVGPQFLPVRELPFILSPHHCLLLLYCSCSVLGLSTAQLSGPQEPQFLGQTPRLNHYLSLVGWRLNSVRVFGYRGAGLDACKCNFNTWRMGLARATMKMERRRLCGSHARVPSVLVSPPRSRQSSTLVLPRVCLFVMYSTVLYSTVHPQPQISACGASW